MQILTGQQGCIPGPFEKGGDIVAHGFEVHRGHPLPHEFSPGSRVETARALRLVQGVLQQGQVRRHRRTLREVPDQIVPVTPLDMLTGEGGMELARQERRRVEILHQESQVAGDDPPFAVRSRRRPRVDLNLDRQLFGGVSRQPRFVQKPGQTHPARVHRLAIVPGHLRVEPRKHQIALQLGHPVPSRVARLRHERKVEIFRESRQIVQEAQRRSSDEGHRPESLALVKRTQRERLEIFSKPVPGLSWIRHALDQGQGFLFHSATVPCPASDVICSHRWTARSRRGLRNRWLWRLSRSASICSTCW